MEKWIGKVAVITGASAGIGAELVKALANAGMIVVGLARRVEPIEELSTKIIGNGKIYGKKCDVTVELDILTVFQWIKETLGGCDVFINIAGIIKAQFFIESDSKDFKDIFDLNILATCICVREAIKNMRERGVKGHVIIMNSILGHRIPNVPIPLFSVYPASKFALTALSQTIRQELSYHKTNIKLTSISPGMVDTDFLKVYESYATLPKLNVEDVTAAVLYALGTPEYVQVEEIILQAMRRHNESPQFEKKCIS